MPPGAAAPAREHGLASIIVVAADSGPGLAACVERALASDTPVEVLVVDNASRDGSTEGVERRCGADARVRILRNAANLGFGAACNRGAAAARGDAFVFLNPDCAPGPDAVRRLRRAAWQGFGLVGARIVDERGVAEPASRRRDPTLRRSLMTLSGLARFEPRWPALAGVAMPACADEREVEDVDAVSGAVMYVPRAVFEHVGGFDEGYFLHAEDLDLCRRVRDAGFRVGCVAALAVVHGKGGSSRHRPLFVAWHKHRALWRWFVKFDPAARNPLLRVLVASGLWLRFALLAPAAAIRQRLAARRVVSGSG